MVDSTQQHHALASSIYRTARRQGQQIITSNYVIGELVALLASPLRMPRPTVIAFIEGLKASPYIEIVHVDTQLDQKAWQLLKKRQDKAWSLVDCASFVIMQQRNIVEAFTSDHHFEQAGYLRLLK